MLFPTFEFLLFFIVVLLFTWKIYQYPKSHLILLLIASYFFYGCWNWAYIPLLFGISSLAFLFAILISKNNKNIWFGLGIIVFIFILVYFKYSGFILSILPVHWIKYAFEEKNDFINPVLPLGISFIIFHAISLLFDIKRGKLNFTPSFVQVLLYICFFPQLIAGPILRASTFITQLTIPRDPHHLKVTRGMILICIGLFKKVILANYLGTEIVDPVFNGGVENANHFIAVYAYAVQIYCDFSGYTDIAIGCAFLLGYRFPLNFRNPYTSSSIHDFWRRWHITLSFWLRDYLYIPMGGARKGFLFKLLFLMITMLIGGLWHGAGWQFIFWGAFHGLLLVINHIWVKIADQYVIQRHQSIIWKIISIIFTFNMVCIGWIWFRAPNFDVALLIFHQSCLDVLQGKIFSNVNYLTLLAIVCGIGTQFQTLTSRAKVERWLGKQAWLFQGAIFALIISLIEYFAPSGIAPFIYFQF
jgi:D-alanyl-lipoteichoic acid acyltransferase DltB (MBOAT superfamily)